MERHHTVETEFRGLVPGVGDSFGDQGWRPVKGIVTELTAPFIVVTAKDSA